MYTFIAISTKWTNHEVCIHILLLAANGQATYPVTVISLLASLLNVPLLGLIASYILKLTWGPCLLGYVCYFTALLSCGFQAGTKANLVAVASFSSCQHHHSIIGV